MATGERTGRRVGAETSKTRDQLLDCVEQLMVAKGYPGVTYRAVASAAGVTSGLVQYYFPALDDLFVAAIRRRGEQNLTRVTAALEARPDEPLRVIGELSREQSTAALATEYLALGNHRASIRSELAAVTERVRKVQLRAVEARYGKDGIAGSALSTEAMLFVLTGVPRLIRMEKGVGSRAAHVDALRTLEAFIDELEPPVARPSKPRSKRSR